jgi:hypothetical protein
MSNTNPDALRDAGYPQGDKNTPATVLLWVRSELTPWELITAEAFRAYRGKHDVLACPSSDELIAAIQARWPGVLGGMVTYDDTWEANAQMERPACPQCHHAPIRYPQGAGPTLCAALAALYIALAGVKE